MDDANQLRFRNGELTAEVRMLQVRLAEANNANAYLLTQASLRADDQNAKDIDRLERQHKKTLRENVQLKAQLGLTRQGSFLKLKNKRDSVVATVSDDSADSLTEDDEDDLRSVHVGRKPRLQKKSDVLDSFDSLLDLDEGQSVEPAPTVEQEDPEPTPEVPEQPRETIGYGLANGPTERPIWEKYQYPDGEENGAKTQVNGHDNAKSGFDITYPDGTVTHVPIPRAPRGNNRGGFRELNGGGFRDANGGSFHEFSDAEHNRLSGTATFIEDLDEHELRDLWRGYARSSRHNAAEWRLYYEENVRPAHLEKERQRAAAASAAAAASPESNAGVPDISPNNTPTSTDSASSFETQPVVPVKSEDIPVEVVEDVAMGDSELTTASAEIVIHDEHSSSTEAEVETTSPDISPDVDSASQNGSSEVSSNYLQILPEVPKLDIPTAPQQSEANQPDMKKAAEQVNALPVSQAAQPLRVSKADMDIAAKIEPLPGLPDFSQNKHSRKDTFLQVAAGNHPSQQAAPGQRVSTVSRFFGNTGTASVDRTTVLDGVDVHALPYRNRESRRSRPDNSYQTIHRGGNNSEDFLPPRHMLPPDSIDDLFTQPKDFNTNPEAFRSVTITVPPSISLASALSKVRIAGGNLVSSAYLETSKMRTYPHSSYNHVILVFTTGSIAQAFVEQSNTNYMRHLCKKDNAISVSVANLIPTATRPIPHYLQREITDYKLTRVLWISAPNGVRQPGPEGEMIPLTADAAWRILVHSGRGDVKVPLHAEQDDQGVIKLEYASMKEAKTASEMMVRMMYHFGGAAQYGYAQDPCGSAASAEEKAAWAALRPEGDSDDEDAHQPEEELAAIYHAEEMADENVAERRAIEDMEGLTCEGSDCDGAMTVIDDASKEASEVGASTKDARSFEGEDQEQNGVMGVALTAADLADDRTEMEAITREMEG